MFFCFHIGFKAENVELGNGTLSPKPFTLIEVSNTGSDKLLQQSAEHWTTKNVSACRQTQPAERAIENRMPALPIHTAWGLEAQPPRRHALRENSQKPRKHRRRRQAHTLHSGVATQNIVGDKHLGPRFAERCNCKCDV